MQPRNGFDAIDAGHDQVDHGEVGTAFGRAGAGLLAAGRCPHAVAEQADGTLQRTQQALVIVDDEDLHPPPS